MSDGNGIKVNGASADIIRGVFDDSRAALLQNPTAAEMVAALRQIALRSDAADDADRPRNEPHEFEFK